LDNNNFYLFGFYLDKFCCRLFEPNQLHVTNTCSHFDLFDGDCQNSASVLFLTCWEEFCDGKRGNQSNNLILMNHFVYPLNNRNITNKIILYRWMISISRSNGVEVENKENSYIYFVAIISTKSWNSW